MQFETNLTAYEVTSQLDALTAWAKTLKKSAATQVDASKIQKIDTAGCQFIDVAIATAKAKAKDVEVKLSPTVSDAFKVLGVTHEPC